MRYEEYITHTYTLSDEAASSDFSALLLTDGTIHYCYDNDVNSVVVMETYLGVVTNYARRNNLGNINGVIRKNDFENWLFLSNRNDFAILKATNNNTFTDGHAFYTNDIYNDSYYDDGVAVAYADLGLSYGSPYNNYYEIGYDEYTFTLQNGRSCLFDYNNLQDPEYITIRGENTTYYNQYLYWKNNDDTYVNAKISVGNIYNRIYQNGYSTGYGSGHATGYIEGYDNGYRTGQNTIGNNVTSTEANAFSYIGNAFGVVADVMSLEVLPNVTLGLCFSIPLVFVLIMTIFKLVRK